jgi:hypothetical protein
MDSWGKHPRRALVRVFAPLLVAGMLAALPPALSAAPLHLPLRIDTRLSLKQQFGYAPEYQRNVPSFDPSNRPYIRSRTASQHVTDHVQTLGPDGWRRYPLVDAVRRDHPTFVATVNAGGYVAESVEFDGHGRAYTLLEIKLRGGTLRNVLLYSLDGGASWKTVTLPFARRAPRDGRDDGTATIEHCSGRNAGEEPPLVAVWRRVSSWPGLRASRNRLYVIRPYFVGDELRLQTRTLVTTRHLGMIQAAGGASFAATSGSTSFIVWTEVAARKACGSPTFVAAFDRISGALGRPVRVALSHPPNDVHTTPGICLDSQGYLHVVTGAHNRPFRYTRSVRPLDTTAWTRPQPVLRSGFRDGTSDRDGKGRQTYLSLVCLPDDTLVVVSRQLRAGVDRVFRGQRYHVLCLQTKPAGRAWSAARRLVFHKFRPGYAIFYQKLAVDRVGRLFLSLTWCDPHRYRPAQRPRHRYDRRMVLVSDDGAACWRFATTGDFEAGLEARPIGAETE